MSGCWCLQTDAGFNLADKSCPHGSSSRIAARTTDPAKRKVREEFTGTWSGIVPTTGHIEEHILFQLCVKKNGTVEGIAHSIGILQRSVLKEFLVLNEKEAHAIFKNKNNKE